MSRSSDLHLLLSDYERMFGEQDDEARAEFALKYSKGFLPSQKKERPPVDDTDPNQPSDHEDLQTTPIGTP
jgi:hypothetical protein